VRSRLVAVPCGLVSSRSRAVSSRRGLVGSGLSRHYFRRRKWNAADADLVRRALIHSGFRTRDATRAVETVAERHTNDTTPLSKEAILREALAVLT
jgi:hypothetical protein